MVSNTKEQPVSNSIIEPPKPPSPGLVSQGIEPHKQPSFVLDEIWESSKALPGIARVMEDARAVDTIENQFLKRRITHVATYPNYIWDPGMLARILVDGLREIHSDELNLRMTIRQFGSQITSSVSRIQD